MARLPVSIVAAFALLASGCGSKLNQTFTGEVDISNQLIKIADGPSSDQVVQISVDAEKEVNAFVVLKKDFTEEVEGTLNGAGVNTKMPPVVLFKSLKSAKAEGEFKVPAKEDFQIYVVAVKEKGKVTVKIVGK